ncbi:MAG: DNA-formamidopyrimidine glycosylase [Candidatus Omnitrophica bacterium]|nr:DNA-formamidopyrimidine glycosylase [Candidatus Omnitrophota bacterium]
MPELPEVETIKRQLKRGILNKKIKEVIVKDKRLIKGISPQIFKSKVEGKSIKDISRRGKVLIIKLEERLFLIFHLRISGLLILSKTTEDFSRVIFRLGDNRLLNFCDARVFGEIRLINDWQKLPFIKAMGPEPLELNKERFVKLFEGKKAKIKPLLMDQKLLAGVGNIYAQESLFCAGIHPERRADRVRSGELEKVHHCLTSILKEAIKKKGTSVDTYRQIDGQEGGYIPFLQVYQRENKPCLNCKTTIKRELIGGRGTYFCPHCQR